MLCYKCLNNTIDAVLVCDQKAIYIATLLFQMRTNYDLNGRL